MSLLPKSKFFPPAELAEEEGVVLFGGRLTPEWLLDAYSHGIFPWPIFDGADIVGGFHATWRISRGAVARMLGWGVMVAVIGLVVRGGAELVTTPIGDGSPIRAGITAAITEVFAAYSMIALAVIYESQRRRAILASPAAMPPAWAAAEPPVPSNPFEPPPPPLR